MQGQKSIDGFCRHGVEEADLGHGDELQLLFPKAFLEGGQQSCLDEIDLFIGFKEEGNGHNPEVRDDRGDSGHGEAAAVQLADPHLAEHRLVVAHDSAGIDPKSDFSTGFLVHLFGKVLELFNPDRTGRGETGDLEEIFWGGLQRLAVEDEKEQGG
ncbi:MAG: hypothetical protein ACD_75C01330G0003 [uncultured bacterium]|nr:MAG: hypothetical protein ACD_75C01330G0003 [uncultured bacterium]